MIDWEKIIILAVVIGCTISIVKSCIDFFKEVKEDEKKNRK